MTPFQIGLVFAVSEHLVNGVSEQTLAFEPRRLLKKDVLDLPTVMAFAFLAGIGAVWIDDKQNRTVEFIAALLVWFLCLLVRQTLKRHLFWLRRSVTKNRYRAWKVSVFFLAILAFGAAFGMYCMWAKATGFSASTRWWLTFVLMVPYMLAVLKYLWSVPRWTLEACQESVNELVRFYCKKAPGNSEGLLKNCEEHKGQNALYYVNRYQVAFTEWNAGKICVCLETQLIERMKGKFVLSEHEMKDLVRSAIKGIARESELEYYANAYVVGEENGAKKAKDVLEKAGFGNVIPELDEMRAIVGAAGRFEKTPSS